MSVFAVEYVYADRPEALAETRPVHREFLRSLLTEGRLLASGPVDGGSGALIIVVADDDAAALALLAADPFAAAGVISEVVVRPWSPVIGPWADLV